MLHSMSGDNFAECLAEQARVKLQMQILVRVFRKVYVVFVMSQNVRG